MNSPDTLSIEGLDITVTQTADALSYTFTPRKSRSSRSSWSMGLVFLVVFIIGLPLAILGLVVYALVVTRASGRYWELALTGSFVLQLGGYLVVAGWATVKISLLSLRSLRRTSIVLAFAGTGVQHGGDRVCDLADLRGLRLFTYTEKIQYLADIALPRDVPPAPGKLPIPPELAPLAPGERPPEKIQAYLSLVIGKEGGTHGLFGGFDVPELRALADDIQRRLAAFRSNQGLESELDPLSVIETTEEDARKLSHTRSASGAFRSLVLGVALAVVNNPLVRTAWCLAMFAGLYGSARVVLAAQLPVGYLAGHILLGFAHLLVLIAPSDTVDHSSTAQQG
jgi:hypothetical protein